MLKIKNVTMRNFLSVGNVSQGIKLDAESIVLILGENRDLGSNGSRNGVGKSAILNAICYSLFGEAITKIKMDNLVNKTNGKNMVVTIDFSINGNEYTITRGRKPQILKLHVNGEEEDFSQGDSRKTQDDIESILGMNKTIFTNIVGLNTFNTPFLSMKAAEQREMMELLMGMTKLSEKAESLKELIKESKADLKDEEHRVDKIVSTNAVLQDNIDKAIAKKEKWERDKEEKLVTYATTLQQLTELDVDSEIKAHKLNDSIKETESKVKDLKSDLRDLVSNRKVLERELVSVNSKLESMKSGVCGECGQDTHTHTEEDIAETEVTLGSYAEALSIVMSDITSLEATIDGMSIAEREDTFYKDVGDAMDHKSKIDIIAATVESEMTSVNPHDTASLEDSLAEVDYSGIERIVSIREHQDFLLKLLTNKDSFIRKKIIERNLKFLNDRLGIYLEEMGLPHSVVFNPNLDVFISEYGRDLDFDNLSRGERTRLILSLSWAFRDLYESMNGSINMMFIDELLDSGLDACGTLSALNSLKVMAVENNKNIFLISHREELAGKVDNIITVCKDNGFTRIDTSEL